METNTNFNFFNPTRLYFGIGEMNNLSKHKLPGRKCLIVISNGKSTKSNGYLSRLIEQLEIANIDSVLFDQVEANPLKSTVMEATSIAKNNNCDFIIALGGGSVIDSSKAIALMATNKGDLWDYIAYGSGKGKFYTEKPLPIVAITTTAGTGSEVDRSGAVTNAQTNEKIAFGVEETFPILSIVDPELMQSVPPLFTAYQGFDALFHSIEVYITNQANLMSDMFAIIAIENVSNYLAKAVYNGKDIKARTHVAFASTMSGYAMELGIISSMHSLENSMTAFHQELPHGAGLIMLSKFYFSFFIDKHIADDRFIKMAQVMGMKEAKEPIDFITALTKLQEDYGMTDLKMSDYGITQDEFEKFAENSQETMGDLFSTDRYDLSIDECVHIYKSAYK